MTRWTIEPIALYDFTVPGPEVLYQRGFFEFIDMTIYSYLLRSEVATVLVDTGLPPDVTPINDSVRGRKGPRAGFQLVGSRLADRLRERRIKPDAIVLTSFGRYAAWGALEFPGIDLYMSARGLAHMHEPEEPALVHPLPLDVIDRIDKANAISGEREIWPGLVLVETGVHHPGSVSLIVSTGSEKVAIADFVFVARNLQEGIALGCAENAAGWHSMVRRIGAMADAIIPIHDRSPKPVGRSDWHSSLLEGPIAGAGSR
jgi:glyoxylase-like metal-dependent hydrolase (beta-lactamase superfamily II)